MTSARVVLVLSLAAAAASPAGAQWSSAVDVGSGVPSASRAAALAGAELRYENANVDFSMTSRSMPLLDATRFRETRLETRVRPNGADGWGIAVEAGDVSQQPLGRAVSRRTELVAGPTWSRGMVQVTGFTGAAYLNGSAVTNHVTTSGLHVDIRSWLGALRVTVRQSGFETLQERDIDTVFTVAGFPFHSHSRGEALTRSRYSSSQFAYAATAGRAQLTVSGGVQTREAAGRASWASAEAVLPLVDRIGVVAQIGRRPPVAEQGIGATRYATLALRVLGWRGDTPPEESRPAPVARVEVRRDAAGSARLELVGVDAARVEVMGDFTDWLPVVLAPAAPRTWRLPLRIEPGIHRMLIRIDGGSWQAPPNLATAASEFGDDVGVLLVPR